MPRVLIATGIMNAGGAETLIMEMLRHKTEAIQYILLVHHSGTLEEGVYDREIRALGVPMVYIPSVGSAGIWKYEKNFQERTQSIGQVDILHSHLNAAGGIIAKAAKHAGIENRIIHCHADITYTGNRLENLLSEIKLELMKTCVNRYGTEFWACSVAAGNRLFRHDRPVLVIPNAIDTEKHLSTAEKKQKAKERLGLSGRFVLGSVGRIAPIKNYELAIRTLAVLNGRGISADYICYGRIADEHCFQSLIALAEKLGVSAQIHFPGNSTDIPGDIAALDVFLMPSKSEGFGMAALEAQAAGIPAIVSVGVPEIVDVGLGLIRFIDFNEVQWADAILNMKDTAAPDHASILEAFEAHGYDSPGMVRTMEAYYMNMAGA